MAFTDASVICFLNLLQGNLYLFFILDIEIFLTLWNAEKSCQKKFELGLLHVVRNYHDADGQVRKWLINRPNFQEKYHTRWVSVLSFYISNFGSMALVREILIIFYSDMVKGDLYNSSILKIHLRQQKVSLVFGDCFYSA